MLEASVEYLPSNTLTVFCLYPRKAVKACHTAQTEDDKDPIRQRRESEISGPTAQEKKQLGFLPLDDLLGEELVNELQVVRLELLDVWPLITLAVKVVWIELLHSLEHLVVLFVHELPVSTLLMPWVKAVVPNHSKSLIGEGGLIFDDVVQVLIMAPRDHDVVKTAARCVDAFFGAVDGIVDVRVRSKRLVAVDDSVIEGTANGESVAHDIPLTFGIKEEQKFAEIVDKARQLHPSWTPITTHGFCGLKQMLDLTKVGVGVRLINEGV